MNTLNIRNICLSLLAIAALSFAGALPLSAQEEALIFVAPTTSQILLVLNGHDVSCWEGREAHPGRPEILHSTCVAGKTAKTPAPVGVEQAAAFDEDPQPSREVQVHSFEPEQDGVRNAHPLRGNRCGHWWHARGLRSWIDDGQSGGRSTLGGGRWGVHGFSVRRTLTLVGPRLRDAGTWRRREACARCALRPPAPSAALAPECAPSDS